MYVSKQAIAHNLCAAKRKIKGKTTDTINSQSEIDKVNHVFMSIRAMPEFLSTQQSRWHGQSEDKRFDQSKTVNVRK